MVAASKDNLNLCKKLAKDRSMVYQKNTQGMTAHSWAANSASQCVSVTYVSTSLFVWRTTRETVVFLSHAIIERKIIFLKRNYSRKDFIEHPGYQHCLGNWISNCIMQKLLTSYQSPSKGIHPGHNLANGRTLTHYCMSSTNSEIIDMIYRGR